MLGREENRLTVPAVILAAGRGSRLGALSKALPKVLVPILGKPLLEWQLAALAAANVSDVHLVGGYRSQLLRDAGPKLINNPDWQTQTMVHSMLLAEPVIAYSGGLICYGDLAYHPDIITTLLASDDDISIVYDQDWHALWTERFGDPLVDAEQFESHNNQLKAIGGRASTVEQIHGQYLGLLKLSPVGLGILKYHFTQLDQAKQRTCDMTELLSIAIGNGAIVRTKPISGKWVEIDSANDIKVVQAAIQDNQRWSHDWRW